MTTTLGARYRATCAALGLPVWRPGMRTLSKFERVVAVDEGGEPACAEAGATEDDNACVWLECGATDPDFTDPATLGCVLAVVREAWGDPGLAVVGAYKSAECMWVVAGTGRISSAAFWRMAQETHTSEAEALVAALEAAVTERAAGGAA